MNVILDIVGSTVIGGAILLLIIQLNSSMNESVTEKAISYNSQSNLTSMFRVMEKDFKKTGFGVSDSIKIKVADKNKITILFDKGNNGTIDSISYYLSPTSALASTTNPNDRILYRVLNNAALSSSNFGVTKFSIDYFDAAGKPAKFRSLIKYFKVSLNVESPYEYNKTYKGAYWEKIIKPKNL